MVYSSLMKNDNSEMENTMMIHKTAKLVRDSITKFVREEKETGTITVSSTRDDIPTDLYCLIR